MALTAWSRGLQAEGDFDLGPDHDEDWGAHPTRGWAWPSPAALLGPCEAGSVQRTDEPNSEDGRVSLEFGSQNEPNSEDDNLSLEFGSDTEPYSKDDRSSTRFGSVSEPNWKDRSSSLEFGSG